MDSGASTGQRLENQAGSACRHFRYKARAPRKIAISGRFPVAFCHRLERANAFTTGSATAYDCKSLRVFSFGKSGKLRAKPADWLHRNAIFRGTFNCSEVRRAANIDRQNVEMGWRAVIHMNQPVIDRQMGRGCCYDAPAICESRARSIWISCAVHTPSTKPGSMPE